MIITVCSLKGGVAKTTSALHLAGALQERGPTLLVDGDLNRSALAWRRRGPGFDFVLIDESDKSARTGGFSYVIVDTPARPGAEDLAALARSSDSIVLPTTPDSPSMDALLLTLQALRRLGAGDRTRVLLTAVPPRPSRVGDEARAALTAAGIPLFAGQIRRLACFSRAADLGLLVRDVQDPRAALGWDDYLSIAKEIDG